MKRVTRVRAPNSVQTNLSKPSGKATRRETKPRLSERTRSVSKAPKASSRVSDPEADACVSASDSTTASEAFEGYDEMVVHYVDDVKSSEFKIDHRSIDDPSNGGERADGSHEDPFHDLEKVPDEESNDGMNTQTNKNSVSSQGDELNTGGDSIGKDSRSQNIPDWSRPLGSRSEREPTTLLRKPGGGLDKSANRGAASEGIHNSFSHRSSQHTEVHDYCSKTEVDDDKPTEEDREFDAWEDALASAHSLGSDNEMVDPLEKNTHQHTEILNLKVGTLQEKVEKMEEELREVAALELSMYSIVPEHGSSASKLNTPARRLFRLYVNARTKQAMVERNIVSGLLFVAKSCANDVSRLTFWLSNAIILRESIFQWMEESTMMKGMGNEDGEDYKDKGAFLDTLKEVESWIFMKTVESLWSQALIPPMRSTVKTAPLSRITKSLQRTALGNHLKETSIDLWNHAFHKAFQLLCPFRAEGRECGCLPALPRMVMENCIARLDVAMFNAVLRESAHQVPTDPISDPISDPEVLPIPPGDLSFASGAQLKNAVGNWSRLLTGIYGIDNDDSHMIDQNSGENQGQTGDLDFIPFRLLNELSDLLMLPKDMVVEPSIKEEVCPSISFTLMTRILCNFTPDEFCPDPVPAFVLEELNFQSIKERRKSRNSARSFPFPAAKVFYLPPPCGDLVEEVTGKLSLSRSRINAPLIRKSGFISDEELEQLSSTLLTSIKFSSSNGKIPTNGGSKYRDRYRDAITRFELLEAWMVG